MLKSESNESPRRNLLKTMLKSVEMESELHWTKRGVHTETIGNHAEIFGNPSVILLKPGKTNSVTEKAKTPHTTTTC